MVQFLTIIIINVTGIILQDKYYPESDRSLRFVRFGERLKRVFPRLEWYQYSGGTFPIRYEAQQIDKTNLLLQWKRIPHEKRYYHQFNRKRTSHCYS